MTWIVEDPLPILLLGAAATLIAAIALAQTRRPPALAALVGVVAVTAVLLLVEWLVVTDVEQVQNTIYATAEELEHNDDAAVVGRIASNANPTLLRAQQLLDRVTFSRVVVTSLTVEVHDAESPATARATFLCWVEAKLDKELQLHDKARVQVSVDLVRQGDRWMYTDYHYELR